MKHAPRRGLRCLPRDSTGTSAGRCSLTRHGHLHSAGGAAITSLRALDSRLRPAPGPGTLPGSPVWGMPFAAVA